MQTALSLQAARAPWLSRPFAPPPLEDFIAGWSSGRLTDKSTVFVPGEFEIVADDEAQAFVVFNV